MLETDLLLAPILKQVDAEDQDHLIQATSRLLLLVQRVDIEGEVFVPAPLHQLLVPDLHDGLKPEAGQHLFFALESSRCPS